MKVSSVQKNLDAITLQKKTVEDIRKDRLEIQRTDRELNALKAADARAATLSGRDRDIVAANIDAASVNPDVLTRARFHGFHRPEDYEKTGREVGRHIHIYDTAPDGG